MELIFLKTFKPWDELETELTNWCAEYNQPVVVISSEK